MAEIVVYVDPENIELARTGKSWRGWARGSSSRPSTAIYPLSEDTIAIKGINVRSGEVEFHGTDGPRPTLVDFMIGVEGVLRQNDHKGEHGWLCVGPTKMYQKLGEEFGEIGNALFEGAPPEVVVRECLDLAAVAMMVAHTAVAVTGHELQYAIDLAIALGKPSDGEEQRHCTMCAATSSGNPTLFGVLKT